MAIRDNRATMPARAALLQFHTRTLLIASGLIAALLLTAVLAPQFLARSARLQVLRDHVDEISRLAASQVTCTGSWPPATRMKPRAGRP
jgi:hypothetical protein